MLITEKAQRLKARLGDGIKSDIVRALNPLTPRGSPLRSLAGLGWFGRHRVNGDSE